MRTDHQQTGEQGARSLTLGVLFGAPALWASAFVLMALIVVEAGKRNAGGVALAGDATDVADLAVLTAASGTDEDILCILDQRNETLSVFGVEQGRSVQLLQVQDLRQAFVQAHGAAGGGR
jgi:hypothetical protein